MRAYSRSKLLRDASLLQDGIRGMAGENIVVNRKVALSDWAVSDFVVATTRAVKAASVGAKDFLQLRRVTRHQHTTGTNAVSSW